MSIELEIKAHIEDSDAIAAALDRLGVFQRNFEKDDRYYGAAGSQLTQFRLRADDGDSVCTFKEKTIDNGLEENTEVEFVVSDPIAFERFAEYLGYTCTVEKKKVGRSWVVDSVRCELSEVNNLGCFLELEVILPDDSSEEARNAAREKLVRLLSDLGVDRDKVEARPYTRMIHEDLSRRHEISCRPL